MSNELPIIVGGGLGNRIVPGVALAAWSGEGPEFIRLRANAHKLSGTRIGRLLVLGPIEHVRFPGGSSGVRWLCVCDCGTLAQPMGTALRQGYARSCGCYKAVELAYRRTTHGYSRTPEYNTWQLMRRRCSNQKEGRYKDYGGRGIKVCDRWANDFAAFLADMGRRPSPQHSIERKDNDLGYEPDNCRWATLVEQANNRRNNVWITAFGKCMTSAQWARAVGISASLLRDRIFQKDWSPERALTTSSPHRAKTDGYQAALEDNTQ